MADYACQEPGWVYTPPLCKRPEDHDRAACGCSYVARLAMAEQLGNDGDRLRHNHLTRDVKPKGQCPACDAYCASGQAPEIDGEDDELPTCYHPVSSRAWVADGSFHCSECGAHFDGSKEEDT